MARGIARLVKVDQASGSQSIALFIAPAPAIGEVTVETYMEGKGEEAREVKRVRVKPWSKLAALDQLMRHAGLSKDKTNAALLDVAARLTAGLKRIGKDTEKGESDEP